MSRLAVNAPAVSETVGTGINISTHKLDDGRWEASTQVEGIPTAKASREVEAIQQLKLKINEWLAGNRI